MGAITVHADRTLGEVTPLLYGHFTEHLVHITYGGMWAEHLYGRRFEAPMVHRRRHTVALPWEPFADRTAHTAYLRAPMPLGRFASPQSGAHHSQAVIVEAGNDGLERGLAQPELTIDAGTEYRFRASVRRIGPVESLRVSLRANDGETVLGEEVVPLPTITETRFGTTPDYRHLWMDDVSFSEVECTITASASDPDGWLALTFEPSPGEVSAVWFDWASLMPADNADGWHSRVVDEFAALPIQLLKWPGGCMADDYDWRLGIGPRDTRFGSVDQAWCAWDDNDVGTDEFIDLCRRTGAEPVVGVNAGTGTPELAAGWVEYCNGSATDSEWGQVRARLGHSEPYGVKYWVVGNEQWGFFERGYVGPDEYARRYLAIAEAMRKVDPTIVIVAVGQAGDFNRTVLSAAAPAIDMLQIHHYTPEEAPEPTDLDSAAKKIATAIDFEKLFESVRADIESVPGAEHVKICLDEWGWGRAGHAGAVFMAKCLNVMHRAAPLVQIGARACAINVDGVIDREGETVVRTAAYEVFRLYGVGHRDRSVEVTVDGADDVDVSALVDGDGCTIFVVNGSAEEHTATVRIDGIDGIGEAMPCTAYVVAVGTQGPAGPSATHSAAGPLGSEWRLPPASLTMISAEMPR